MPKKKFYFKRTFRLKNIVGFIFHLSKMTLLSPEVIRCLGLGRDWILQVTDEIFDFQLFHDAQFQIRSMFLLL